ncbi:MAG: Cof-type HAD-IIB family hydrolase [Bacillota bacterium]
MVRLAIFDLDNTLLNTDKSLSEENIEAVKALKKTGVNVAIATGRAFEMAKPYANLLGLYEGPIVANNGAMVQELSNKRLMHGYVIDKDAQATMIDFAYENRYPFVVYNEAGIHSLDNERLKAYEAWNKDHPDSQMTVHVKGDLHALKTIDAYKILIIIKDLDRFNQALENFETLKGASVTKSHDTFLDVIPEKGNKGEGARYLMKHYGVSEEETLVFGDNDNDAQMLEQISLSFAMKNATIKAKQAASYATALDNDHAGVADALYTHILKNTD